MARSVVWTDLRHWEETTQPVLFELARTARGFLDIGAFSGVYTLLACAANPRLRALAFEPNPNTAPLLRRNVEINGLQHRVTVVEKALSAAPGKARLSIPHDTTAASLDASSVRSPTSSVEVAVTTADEVAAGLDVDLVKIDVEGLESEVMRGMTGLIHRCRPQIIVECLDAEALAKVCETTQDLGYTSVHHLGRNGPAAAGPGFVPPPRYANFLIAP
ncbi:FkbM family methyltransferase [Streptomyces sp. NPDC057136]|uniref:FkbM family methyltransferase n=1 Tax=Streptomyces sp. NPDC057136 TaxID=3346029 RepID=UPI0036256D6E